MVETRDGYVVDTTYSAQVFQELSPLYIGLMAEMNGCAPPDLSAPRYLELGFGQGVTLNAVAATNPGEYEGVDFIPEHVANAEALAQASGAKLKLHADSFAEFAKKRGAGFDLIALHGVWSWVDDAAREAIMKIIGKRLKPGGLALISYNTPTGWAGIDPLRLLFRRYARQAEGDTQAQMRAAVGFAERLQGAGAAFFAQHPTAARALEQMKTADLHYLVHEYLNEGYRTASFAEVAEAGAAAGLTYVGPARPAEFLDRRRLPAAAQAIVDEIADPLLAELAREFLSGVRFRSDLYVKGDPSAVAGDALAARRFVLTGFPGGGGAQGAGNEAFQRLTARVKQVLAENDAAPKTYGEIDAACPNASFEQIGWALMSLLAAGQAAPAHDDAAREAAAPAAQALNAGICARAAEKMGIQMLACPATGSAVPVRGVAQIYLHCRDKGDEAPAAVWAALKAQGEAMIADGQRLQGDAANLDAIRRDMDWFNGDGLARLVRLGVAAA